MPKKVKREKPPAGRAKIDSGRSADASTVADDSVDIIEFLMSREGIRLLPAYIGAGGVLTGSSRLARESREKAEASAQKLKTEQRRRELERKRRAIEAQIEMLQAEFSSAEEEMARLFHWDEDRDRLIEADRRAMAHNRGASLSAVDTPETNLRGDQ